MNKNMLTFLIGGIFSLAIAMGIGRFSFTVILPYMQSANHFSNSTAGFLATSNYLGYLVGAIVAGKMNLEHNKLLYLRLSLIISILTTALMGVSNIYLYWYVLRFASGVASAFIFVVTSSIILDVLSKAGKNQLSGIFYSGVGLGIALSGIIVSPLHRYFDWNGTWIGLALLCILLFIFIFVWISDKKPIVNIEKRSSYLPIQLPPTKWIKWLIISYGFEGLGYIITGTFIVAIANNSPSFIYNSATVWIVAGLAAIPSCIIWSYIAKKFGYIKTLIIAMILQSIGVFLPVVSENALSIYTSSMLFGGTFMGITTLATTLAKQILPVNSHRILGFLTASYAFGQMIGPSVAGILSTITNSFNHSLIGASLIIFVGACCLINGLKFEKNNP